MKPLVKEDFEKLSWDKVFPGFNAIRIKTDMDGSCFFHAIAKAYFKPYINGDTNYRKEYIKSLRKELSIRLGSTVEGIDKTYYETINNGELPDMAEELPECSLEKMQAELDSSQPISNIYNEFVSDQLDIDIYILDAIKRDVYMTASDNNVLYKKRKSVVLLYLPGHYELVGLLRNKEKNIQTLFDANSPFIRRIQERMNELCK